jgi:death-on-curing protein
MQIETLNKSEIIRIHNLLVEDFAQTEDPILPPGVKDEGLLESAIGRQFVCYGTQLKYPSIHSNAATLLYGICCDHPFHNGNKRTALVAMLAHLDKNKHTMIGVRQAELYSMIIGVANHTFGIRVDPRKKGAVPKRRKSDEEVSAIADWIKRYIHPIERGERQITYRELRKILKRFGYFLEYPKKNMIDIVKIEYKTKGLIKKRTVELRKKIYSIPYPGDSHPVSIGLLKKIRTVCQLREEDGVDSSSFYDSDTIIDSFINRYRTVLRRLAHE